MNNQKETQKYLTSNNYWRIIDYMYQQGLLDGKNIKKVELDAEMYQGLIMNILNYELESRNKNLVLVITDKKSNFSISITFEDVDNIADVSPLSENALGLGKEDLERMASQFFKEILAEIIKMEKEKREYNQKIGNYLTIENFRKIERYIYENDKNKDINYYKTDILNLSLEYGEGRITITDKDNEQKYYTSEGSIENNPREELNKYFKQIFDYMNK